MPSFYERNKISQCDVTDVWGIINEPFLDTEHDDEFIEWQYAKLEKCGISREDCECLRQEVSERMFAYNFDSMLWEWVHLGLCDVLWASIGILSGDKFRLPLSDFEEFYWRAINIALKGFGIAWKR